MKELETARPSAVARMDGPEEVPSMYTKLQVQEMVNRSASMVLRWIRDGKLTTNAPDGDKSGVGPILITSTEEEIRAVDAATARRGRNPAPIEAATARRGRNPAPIEAASRRYTPVSKLAKKLRVTREALVRRVHAEGYRQRCVIVNRELAVPDDVVILISAPQQRKASADVSEAAKTSLLLSELRALSRKVEHLEEQMSQLLQLWDSSEA